MSKDTETHVRALYFRRTAPNQRGGSVYYEQKLDKKNYRSMTTHITTEQHVALREIATALQEPMWKVQQRAIEYFLEHYDPESDEPSEGVEGKS